MPSLAVAMLVAYATYLTYSFRVCFGCGLGCDLGCGSGVVWFGLGFGVNVVLGVFWVWL